MPSSSPGPTMPPAPSHPAFNPPNIMGTPLPTSSQPSFSPPNPMARFQQSLAASSAMASQSPPAPPISQPYASTSLGLNTSHAQQGRQHSLSHQAQLPRRGARTSRSGRTRSRASPMPSTVQRQPSIQDCTFQDPSGGQSVRLRVIVQPPVSFIHLVYQSLVA